MVSVGPAAPNEARGLSSIDAVLRKLEQDQTRSRVTRGAPMKTLGAKAAAPGYSGGASPRSKAPAATPAPAAMPLSAVVETAAPANVAAAVGGAARAASFLRVVEGGRTRAEDAAAPSPVEIPLADVEAAVIHPADLGEAVLPVAPRAPAGSPSGRPSLRSAPGRPVQASSSPAKDEDQSSNLQRCQMWQAPSPSSRSVDDSKSLFQSNPDNFTHILRFLREQKNFKGPEDAEARANLREEALYFGCVALVNHLDGGSCAGDGAVAAVEGSAMATDLADLGVRVAEVAS